MRNRFLLPSLVAFAALSCGGHPAGLVASRIGSVHVPFDHGDEFSFFGDVADTGECITLTLETHPPDPGTTDPELSLPPNLRVISSTIRPTRCCDPSRGLARGAHVTGTVNWVDGDARSGQLDLDLEFDRGPLVEPATVWLVGRAFLAQSYCGDR